MTDSFFKVYRVYQFHHSAILSKNCTQLRILFLWEMRDSNPRPTECKSVALNQLRQSPLT